MPAKTINAPDFFTLNDLLGLINEGKIAMPEFQREFVWSPAQVSELMLTIARRWPCGTFLLLEGGEGDAQEFDLRPIVNGPQLDEKRIQIVVLDGQQRLTAVFHAYADQASKEVHYVDIEKLRTDGELDEEHIRFLSKKKFSAQYPTTQSQAEAGVIKIYDLVDDERYLQWMDFLPPEKRTGLFDLRGTLLAGFREYAMPAIILPKDTPLSALAKIFETINRTGQALNTVDLMIAKLYPHDFKLRDEIDNAKSANELLTRFNTPGIEILKLIALWERLRPRDPDEPPLKVKGVRESDVLTLSPSYVISKFPEAVDAYEAALHFVHDKCGVVQSFLLPSLTMLLPIADAIKQGIDEAHLTQWYWSTVLAQSYSQGANSQALADARVLRAWNQDPDGETAKPAVVTAGKVSLDALKDVRRRNEILLRGILCLLVLNEAKDWKMDGNTFRTEEESLDIHHVFAQNYLLSIGKPKSETDRILNLTLLKSSTNQAIRDQAPDTVLARTDIDNNALAAHLFDPVLLSAKDYDAVLAARLLRLQEFLKNRFPWVSITQGDED